MRCFNLKGLVVEAYFEDVVFLRQVTNHEYRDLLVFANLLHVENGPVSESDSPVLFEFPTAKINDLLTDRNPKKLLGLLLECGH